jgi:AcrR family transcriptional regulator
MVVSVGTISGNAAFPLCPRGRLSTTPHVTTRPVHPPPEQLPHGRHGLDPAFVVANQRDRILAAMAQEVADKGYTEVATGDVIARAGVSRKTFYELFRDKADCFLAAYDSAITRLMAHVAGVFERMPEPSPARTRAVLAAVLERLAAEPTFARLCIVEASAAGPEAIKRYTDAMNAFVPLLDQIESYPAAKRYSAAHPQPGPVERRALVGGIVWVAYTHIVAGETERLPDLLPELTHFLLTPFIGDKQAAKIAFGR